eukprot:5796479-Pleurochrysis_carterae.AAC.1
MRCEQANRPSQAGCQFDLVHRCANELRLVLTKAKAGCPHALLMRTETHGTVLYITMMSSPRRIGDCASEINRRQTWLLFGACLVISPDMGSRVRIRRCKPPRRVCQSTELGRRNRCNGAYGAAQSTCSAPCSPRACGSRRAEGEAVRSPERR